MCHSVVYDASLPQQILIDGSGHLLGRLASIVAKAILQGNVTTMSVRVTATLMNCSCRTEDSNSSMRRNQHQWKLLSQQVYVL